MIQLCHGTIWIPDNYLILVRKKFLSVSGLENAWLIYELRLDSRVRLRHSYSSRDTCRAFEIRCLKPINMLYSKKVSLKFTLRAENFKKDMRNISSSKKLSQVWKQLIWYDWWFYDDQINSYGVKNKLCLYLCIISADLTNILVLSNFRLKRAKSITITSCGLLAGSSCLVVLYTQHGMATNFGKLKVRTLQVIKTQVRLLPDWMGCQGMVKINYSYRAHKLERPLSLHIHCSVDLAYFSAS